MMIQTKINFSTKNLWNCYVLCRQLTISQTKFAHFSLDFQVCFPNGAKIPKNCQEKYLLRGFHLLHNLLKLKARSIHRLSKIMCIKLITFRRNIKARKPISGSILLPMLQFFKLFTAKI